MEFFKKDIQNTTVFGIFFKVEGEQFCIIQDIKTFSTKPAIMRPPLILETNYKVLGALDYYKLLKDYSDAMIKKLEKDNDGNS